MGKLMESGRILAVWIERLGTSVAVDAPAGTQVIQVEFTPDFDEDGGQLLHVPTGDVYDYATADPDEETITLASPLPAGKSLGEGDALYVFPLADDYMANVLLDDAEDDEEPIIARVPHSMRPVLPEGVREPVTGEPVLVEEAGEEWVIRDVIGTAPTSYEIVDDLRNPRVFLGEHTDGTYALTYANGVKPPTPSAPTLIAAELSLVVFYDGTFEGGVARPADVVRVDIHESETPGFTPDGSTIKSSLPGEGARLLVLDNQEHFVKLVAVTNADVASDPSAEVSATPLAVTNLGVVELDAAKIFSPSQVGWRLEIGDPSKPLHWWDGTQSGFYVSHDPAADESSVYASGRFEFGTNSLLESDYVDLFEQPVGPVEPALRQSRHTDTDTNATSISVAWPSETQKGNLLLAYIYAQKETFDPAAPIITPPAGWILTQTVTRSAQSERLSLYRIPDAARRTGTETFTFDATCRRIAGLFEYAGVADLDQTTLASGSSTTILSGTTATTTQAEELWFAVGQKTAVRDADPSNGFSNVGSGTGEGLSRTFTAARNVTAIGQASTSWTDISSGNWLGLIGTFKAKTSTGDPEVPAEVGKVRIYAKDRNGEPELHSINSGGVVRVLGNDAVFLDEVEFDGVTAGVTFTGIDQNYRDLMIVFRGNRINDTAAFRDLTIRLNGDVGTNYDTILHRQLENGTQSTSNFDAGTELRMGIVGRWMSNSQFTIHGYSRVAPKVARAHGYAQDSGQKMMVESGGRWDLTDPITQVDVSLAVGDFEAGSGLQIWGVGKLS